jgi:Tol biopolymer transport system component
MRRSSPFLIAAAVLALVVAAGPSDAQYFGQNKVQYRDFDFKVLQTANFDVHYYPEEQEHAEQVARMAERWYGRLARMFQYQIQGRQPLILYASAPHFRQTNTTLGDVGEGTGGFTDLYKRRVVLPSAGPLAETDHVLGHELVHAFQFAMSSGASTGSALPPVTRLPLWFVEGMAEYLSLGPLDPQTAMWMRDAMRAEKLPRLKDLGNPRYFPYRWGHAFFAFVGGKWGDAKVAELMKAAARSGDVDGTLKQVLDLKSEDLTKQWHEALRAAYGPFLESRRTASTYGPAVISEKNAGELNVGPVLSPDGERLAFLSEKDLFSVDLFVADADSGQVRQKLLSTATDPHFDSLQFIDSAGAWSRAGDRFALATVRKGHAAIAITDPTRGETIREVSLPDLDEAKGPTWSPDGKSIAFSALRGGLLDLYVLDLESGRTRRLTTDAFAEMQPAWSPDGREIAFVTDRFSSRLSDLSFGNYRLAVVDVASGAIAPLPSFGGVKHIDPHWSADGKSLFFVSDRAGASNVYRLERATGEVYQVTDLATGVSGITALSPSLSVAADRPRVAFAVREDGKYRIHRIDDPEKLTGQPVETAPARAEAQATAALLPPVDRKGQAVSDYRRDPDRGLPGPDLPPAKPYKSGLSLDALGAPTIEVGASRFGGYVAGGVALSFSDMLGDHNLTAIVDANGQVQDIGGQVAYTNLKKKWDWAVGVQRIPYLTAGGYSQTVTQIGGEPVLLEQLFEERQTNHSVFGAVYRPFSRAFRLELGGAYQRISFSSQVVTQAFSLRTGEFLGESTEDFPTPAALDLVQGSAALVYDTAVFGATSPILGRRFRVEASPTTGSIDYTGVLADFRQYFMPKRPFTLAFRGLHYGRYGSGSEDPRFYDLYLGYPYLVRGYDSGSFTSDECGLTSCPAYENLFGSRMLVGNFELRFPLLGALGAKNLYGPVPIEIALFADGGVAWRNGETPSLFGGERDAVASVGVTTRINAFGFAVVALDFARPLDRPGKGWVFTFSLSPGF